MEWQQAAATAMAVAVIRDRRAWRQWEIVPIEGCQTCLLFIANGDTPETTNDWHWSDGEDAAEYPDGWHPREIERNWADDDDPHHGPWQLVASCSNEDCQNEDGDYECEGSFSWSGCDVCGTRLGGDLHHMTAMRRVYSDLELLARAKGHHQPQEDER